MPARTTLFALWVVALAASAAAALPLPGIASPTQVDAIAQEFDLPALLPLPKPEDAPPPLGKLAFSAAALRGYETDVRVGMILKPENADKYRFRVTVLAVFDMLRKEWASDGKWLLTRVRVPGTITADVRQSIAHAQDHLAALYPELELTAAKLEALEPLRAKEPKRWQAHYDYAVAQVRLRRAFLDEYNRALGSVRNDNLPEFDPARHDGFQLRVVERMRSTFDTRTMAKDAHKLLDRIAETHPGTPWAVQAKRDRATPLGLEWVPTKLPQRD